MRTPLGVTHLHLFVHTCAQDWGRMHLQLFSPCMYAPCLTCVQRGGKGGATPNFLFWFVLGSGYSSHFSGQELPKHTNLRLLHLSQSYHSQILLPHPQHHNNKMNGEVSELLHGSAVPNPLLAAWLSYALATKRKKQGDCKQRTFKALLLGKYCQWTHAIWFCSDVLNPL